MKKLFSIALISMLFLASVSLVLAVAGLDVSLRGYNGVASIGGVTLVKTANTVDFNAYSKENQGQGSVTMQGYANGVMSSVRVNFAQTTRVVEGNLITVNAAYRGTQYAQGKAPYAISGTLTYVYNSLDKTVVVTAPGFGASFANVVNLR